MGGLLCFLLQIYWFVLLAYVIFSWVPNPPQPLVPFVAGVRRLVEPVAAPVRRVIPPIRAGGVAFDLSILVVFFALIVLQRVVCSLGW